MAAASPPPPQPQPHSEEVRDLLGRLDLEKYVPVFEKEDVKTIATLRLLTEEELEKLVPSIGGRRLLKAELAKASAEDPPVHFTMKEGEVTLGNKLGVGNFGCVYHATWQGGEVAVKRIKSTRASEAEVHSFMREAAMLQQVDFVYTVHFFGAYLDAKNNICLVTEYMRNGSLDKFLCNRRKQFSSYRLTGMALDVAYGLQFLHNKSIIHRDIAARNILVGEFTGEKYIIKISDYGLARQTQPSTDSYYMTTSFSPIKWTALESLKANHKFTKSSDIWSWGVLMWELFSWGDLPYPGVENSEMKVFLKQGNRLPKPEDCPDELYQQVMMQCFTADANMRITVEEVIAALQKFLATEQPAAPSQGPVPAEVADGDFGVYSSKLEDIGAEGYPAPQATEQHITTIFSSPNTTPTAVQAPPRAPEVPPPLPLPPPLQSTAPVSPAPDAVTTAADAAVATATAIATSTTSSSTTRRGHSPVPPVPPPPAPQTTNSPATSPRHKQKQRNFVMLDPAAVRQFKRNPALVVAHFLADEAKTASPGGEATAVAALLWGNRNQLDPAVVADYLVGDQQHAVLQAYGQRLQPDFMQVDRLLSEFAEAYYEALEQSDASSCTHFDDADEIAQLAGSCVALNTALHNQFSALRMSLQSWTNAAGPGKSWDLLEHLYYQFQDNPIEYFNPNHAQAQPPIMQGTLTKKATLKNTLMWCVLEPTCFRLYTVGSCRPPSAAANAPPTLVAMLGFGAESSFVLTRVSSTELRLSTQDRRGHAAQVSLTARSSFTASAWWNACQVVLSGKSTFEHTQTVRRIQSAVTLVV
eukprot:TRINITY_DN871_c0_g1_i6.p1 TRINITY_DN871_c0_g1~~TRINITY_DN871_c0_g1_i6.p1  ORF type:complete len:820 (-),score=181.97 TRINITY_DN871_c0_g1_i6:85-2520(-)